MADEYDSQSFTGAFVEHSINLSKLKTNGELKDAKVLDLAAGTGSLSITAAEELKGRGSVLATDFSPKMIELLNKKIEQLKLDNITTQVMDAQHIDFPDETFDFVFCLFSMMLVPDPNKAIQEIYRVLKKGGQAVITTWYGLNPIGFLLRNSNKRFTETHPEIKSQPQNATIPFSKKEELEVTQSQHSRQLLFANVPFESSLVEQQSCTSSVTIQGLLNIARANPQANAQYLADLPQLLAEEFPTGKAEAEATALIGIGTK